MPDGLALALYIDSVCIILNTQKCQNERLTTSEDPGSHSLYKGHSSSRCNTVVSLPHETLRRGGRQHVVRLVCSAFQFGLKVNDSTDHRD